MDLDAGRIFEGYAQVFTIFVNLSQSKFRLNRHYFSPNCRTPRKPMWVPTPLYERIPQFWLLLGLLFIALGLYVGFEFGFIFFYLALGVVCVSRGIWVQMLRTRYRDKRRDLENDVTDNDETGIRPAGR